MDKLRAYAQLLRIPNVFTAMADIVLGWGLISFSGYDPFYTGSGSSSVFGYTLLTLVLGSSSCLYCAGMALNDFFDVDQDRQERPYRPIPSGRVSRRKAGIIGFTLLASGVGLAGAMAFIVSDIEPVFVASLLAGCILLYDSCLKRTGFGPIMMGACRSLNVLLGASAYFSWYAHEGFILKTPYVFVVGLYITGVTWFARTEARKSQQHLLVMAALVMFLAWAIMLINPTHLGKIVHESPWFMPLAIAWGIIVGVPITVAIRSPEPRNVQRAVKTCILGLIPLDAILAFSIVGWPGLLILFLLPPSLILGRWVYST